jgi:pimeloyl-ACP methyl ester carboxylesterase
VGWSLGGVVARETARLRPDLVERVVTYGTPLRGPRFTSAHGLYSPTELARIEREIADTEGTPITVPGAAIDSRRDGVVDWTTCVDDVSPRATNIEVGSSHVGMGLDPDVWTAVANALQAQSPAR